jgi:hypothetical protein
MQIDRSMLNHLQRLSDAQLGMILRKLREAGVDLKAFGIPDGDVSQVRAALRNASDADLARANQQYERWRQEKRP